jgi:flagellar biosynthesis protein FlhB
MSNNDRTVPPGEGRVAAATRAGLFPRSGAIVSGFVLLTMAWLLSFFGLDAGQYLQDLTRFALDAPFSRPEPVSAILTTFTSAASKTLPFLAMVFLIALLVALLPVIIAKRRGGNTAVPLPKAPKTVGATLVINLLGSGVFLLLVLYILRRRIGALWPFIQGDYERGSSLLLGASEMLAAGGIVLLFVGLAQIIVARHFLWRALFLSSSEARREARDARGDPAVKREQRRLAKR